MVAEAVSDPFARLHSVSSRPAMATESGRTPSRSHRPGVASESTPGGAGDATASNLGARLASAADLSDTPPTKTRIVFNVTANDADLKSGFLDLVKQLNQEWKGMVERVEGLEKFETPSDTFHCDTCSKGNVPKGSVLWGCRECNYDLCGRCVSAPHKHRRQSSMIHALRPSMIDALFNVPPPKRGSTQILQDGTIFTYG